MLWIAGSFIASAAALLVLQHLVVADLLNNALGLDDRRLTELPVDDDGGPMQQEMLDEHPDGGPMQQQMSGGQLDMGQISVSPVGVRSNVLAGLQGWSLGFIGVFALVATVVAWSLSRRYASRIHEASAIAADVMLGHRVSRMPTPDRDAEARDFAETFNSMLDRLEEGAARQELFVANASHELRTPLSTARLALEIPVSQGHVPGNLLPSVEAALKAVGNCERIISSLLVLARAEAIRTVLAAESSDGHLVDLAALAEAELAKVAAVARAESVSIETELGCAEIHGHQGMLEIAVRNLVENAIGYNHPGGSVRVVAGRERGMTVVVVENDGLHHDPADVGRLADPFHRGQATRRAPPSAMGARGHGLGLSIVASVAAAHGGSLQIDARREGGLLVALRFPDRPDAPGGEP